MVLGAAWQVVRPRGSSGAEKYTKASTSELHSGPPASRTVRSSAKDRQQPPAAQHQQQHRAPLSPQSTPQNRGQLTTVSRVRPTAFMVQGMPSHHALGSGA